MTTKNINSEHRHGIKAGITENGQRRQNARYFRCAAPQIGTNGLLKNPTARFIMPSMNTKELISRAMRELGKRTSPAKAKAARKNGKLGGRPRKVKASQPAVGSHAYNALLQIFHEVKA